MTRDRACKLSIVCPVHEEKELSRFHFELAASLAGLPPECKVEILYVDDGSRDGTLAQLRRLATFDSSIQYLSFSRRFGQQAALSAGIEHASGDVAITLDAGMGHPPGLIQALLGKWREGYDVVLTRGGEVPGRSLFHSFSWRACDCRLLGRPAIDSLMRLPEAHRHLGRLVEWIGFRTTTVDFPAGAKGSGAGQGTRRQRLSLAVEEMLSFSKLPLRCAVLLGLLSTLVGVGQGAFCAGQLLRKTPAVPWIQQALLLAVLLGGGFILCALGILGEYVGRVYEQVKGRPLYLVKEMSPPAVNAARAADRSLREQHASWWNR